MPHLYKHWIIGTKFISYLLKNYVMLSFIYVMFWVVCDLVLIIALRYGRIVMK